ncbi:hypothetical protein [Haloarcula rubripromontorii]|uniref:hypothetical protein n=1 Tax=Haloarcula rubripromontorii TaxID=1705562 RepID=UPI00345BA4AE
MGTGLASGRLSRWTRYFTVASAFSLVVAQALALLGTGRSLVTTVALFGFVCPMIFGMAYLLLPSYVGRTLVDQRLPGLHFALAYLGAAGLAVGRVIDSTEFVRVGSTLWSLGVTIFVGALALTIVPAVRERPEVVLRSADRPQRSTRLATATIAVAIGYLVVGTVTLLSWVRTVPLPHASFPAAVHYYGAGFGALLIFALGARLIPGFFRVTPPRLGTWVVLVAGAVAPGLLAASLWGGIAFRIGGVLQTVAMIGYAGVVGYVFWQSERRRPGLYGIVLGALAGIVAVGINLPAAFGTVIPGQLRTHALTVITGFFALTVVGYAVQFFGVTGGRFRGATNSVVYATFAMLTLGIVLSVVGLSIDALTVVRAGPALGLSGALTYAYLISRRLLPV